MQKGSNKEVIAKDTKMVMRNYIFEIRAEENEENGKFITGRPIIYESKTDLTYFDEIIQRGALDNANLKDIRFLVNHNTDMIPLARSRNNNKNSTMQITVDKDGMAIRVNLDVENNVEAKSLYSAIQRGDITGMSFLFSINKEQWDNLDTEHPTRNIIEIGEVLEVSAVTFPAYEMTEINARDSQALDNVRSALDNARGQTPDGVKSGDSIDLEKEKNKNKTI